jgi:hypothetical protein
MFANAESAATIATQQMPSMPANTPGEGTREDLRHRGQAG